MSNFCFLFAGGKKLHLSNFSLAGIIFIFGLFVTGCVQKKQMMMTVLGTLPAQKMDVTLAHEHVLVDFIGADSTGYFRWDRAKVEERVLPYLLELEKYGVKTFIECTPAYLGRDPILLRSLSQKSGLHILTNTGYYGAHDNRFVPRYAFDETAEQLAARWINEWEDGIEGSGIKPGFIKIAVGPDDSLSEMHEKLIRAAALTHLATGLTIMSHTGPENPAFAQLEILQQMGVAPEAFIWTHAQRGNKQAHVEAAKLGAWVSLDNVSPDSARIGNYMEMLSNMKENNLLHRVLLSHDAGWYHVGEPDGGNFREFTTIFKILIPALSNNGFTGKDIDQLLVINPREAFTIKVRKLNI